jgi:hypothetical protein
MPNGIASRARTEMTAFDKTQIAARIRELIGTQDGGDPAVSARRLGVEEIAFRMSIDDMSPQPTIDVIAAIVRIYGVDPSWLVTGMYSAATHRRTLESDDDVSTRAVLEIFGHAPMDAGPPLVREA